MSNISKLANFANKLNNDSSLNAINIIYTADSELFLPGDVNGIISQISTKFEEVDTSLGSLTTAISEIEIPEPVTNSSVPNIKSRAYAISDYHPATAPDYIRTEGYFTAGDRGGGLYKKVVSDPAHALKFTITLSPSGTAIYEYVAESFGANGLAAGMVGDGAWNNLTGAGIAAFIGTDNTTPYSNLLIYCNIKRVQAFVPSGEYTFARQALNGYPYVYVPTWVNVRGESRGSVKFLLDHSGNGDLHDTCLFMAQSSVFVPVDADPINKYEYFECSHITFEGLWSHAKPFGGNKARLLFPIFLFNTAIVKIHDCNFYDIQGGAIWTNRCGEVEVWNNTLDRVTSDGIRAISTNYVNVHHNRLHHVDDDGIALHSYNLPDISVPTREGLIVSNNIITDSESIQVLGAQTMIVSDNLILRSHGSCISTLAVGTEGGGAQTSINIHGNIIQDPFHRADGGTWGASDPVSGAIEVGAAFVRAAAIPLPGFPNASDIVYEPWDGTYTWGSLHAKNSQDSGFREKTAGTFGVNITNNTIQRTYKSGITYSQMGFGEYFDTTNWYNPTLTDDSWVINAITLAADMRNVNVMGNTIRGFRKGCGVYFRYIESSIADFKFLRIKIDNNIVEDCKQGVGHSMVGAAPDAVYWDVDVSNNLFDLDPYLKHSARNTNGSWDQTYWSGLEEMVVGVMVYGVRGFKVRGNTTRHAYALMWPGYDSDELRKFTEITGNYQEGEGAGPGWNASNKGIGHIILHPGVKYRNYGSDPTNDTNWNRSFAVMQEMDAGTPTSGFFTKGHLVRNSNTASMDTIYGWLRITTSTAHVIGTDWSVIHADNNNT